MASPSARGHHSLSLPFFGAGRVSGAFRDQRGAGAAPGGSDPGPVRPAGLLRSGDPDRVYRGIPHRRHGGGGTGRERTDHGGRGAADAPLLRQRRPGVHHQRGGSRDDGQRAVRCGLVHRPSARIPAHRDWGRYRRPASPRRTARLRKKDLYSRKTDLPRGGVRGVRQRGLPVAAVYVRFCGAVRRPACLARCFRRHGGVHPFPDTALRAGRGGYGDAVFVSALSARGQLRLRRGVRDGGKRPLSCWGPPWAGGGCPSTASLRLPFTDSGSWDGDFSPSAFSTHCSAAC